MGIDALSVTVLGLLKGSVRLMLTVSDKCICVRRFEEKFNTTITNVNQACPEHGGESVFTKTLLEHSDHGKDSCPICTQLGIE